MESSLSVWAAYIAKIVHLVLKKIKNPRTAELRSSDPHL
jgi:hypothetical protein